MNLVRIGRGQVHLGNRNDNGNLFTMSEFNGFHRLGHHHRIRCDDQDDNIRHLGTASAHRAKRFVTRRIEERNLSHGSRHFVGTDVLRNAAGLSGNDMRLANPVQKWRSCHGPHAPSP